MTLHHRSDERQLFPWAPIVALAVGFSAVAAVGLVWPSPTSGVTFTVQVVQPGTETPAQLGESLVSTFDGKKFGKPVAVRAGPYTPAGTGIASVRVPDSSVELCLQPGPAVRVTDPNVVVRENWSCRPVDIYREKTKRSVTFTVAATP